LIYWLNSSLAHISILLNAHGAWLKLSHPEMRLVSAAIGAPQPFSFLRRHCWFFGTAEYKNVDRFYFLVHVVHVIQ
jgi:hypothetical protein